MKQLKTIYAVATFMGCALFTGCNDDYLQKYPEDSLNEEAFFKTVTDLETYTNGFYGMLEPRMTIYFLIISVMEQVIIHLVKN